MDAPWKGSFHTTARQNYCCASFRRAADGANKPGTSYNRTIGLFRFIGWRLDEKL